MWLESQRIRHFDAGVRDARMKSRMAADNPKKWMDTACKNYLAEIGCPEKVAAAEAPRTKLIWLAGQAVKLRMLKERA